MAIKVRGGLSSEATTDQVNHLKMAHFTGKPPFQKILRQSLTGPKNVRENQSDKHQNEAALRPQLLLNKNGSQWYATTLSRLQFGGGGWGLHWLATEIGPKVSTSVTFFFCSLRNARVSAITTPAPRLCAHDYNGLDVPFELTIGMYRLS